MAESLRRQTLIGVIWSGLEKAFTLLTAFVVNIIMARLLTPADYGIIGIIAVFVSFSQLFIDGGFATAIISKVDRNENDYRTVFVFNILMSVFLYFAIFILAPFLQSFYQIDNLANVIRVYCLMLVISSFSAIQTTIFTAEVDFKTITKISIPSGIISGIIGVYCASKGLGVWAIVAQHLSMSVIRVLLSIYYSKWTPRIGFSWKSFKVLFGFSSNLIISSLIDRIYTNAFPLFIGKFFPPSTLGLYTKGDEFGRLPASIFDQVFNRVTLPLMSKIQNENDNLRQFYSKSIKLSSFLVFPVMMLIVVLAYPITKILLTEKWLDCVIYMQIISMAMMMNHIGTINRNLLYIKQHSDYALRLEIIKKVIAITIFIVSTSYGVLGVCIGQLVYGMMAPSLNSIYTNKLIKYNYGKQLNDYCWIWLFAVLSAIIPLWLINYIQSSWIALIIGIISYLTIYLLLNYLFNKESTKFVITESYLCLKKRF